MQYKKTIPAVFLRRLNRFVAVVLLEGQETVVHVKNTGRCKELLIPGCCVWLSCADMVDQKHRKTSYDLIAVEKQRGGKTPLLINMDSQAVNDVAEEWLKQGRLFSKDALIRREVSYGDSRFDFFVEDHSRKAFVEAKGVTLETDGCAAFPDAPTVRGVKHLQELIRAKENGYDAYLLFVVQMKEVFSVHPNDQTHPEFGAALRQAVKRGVDIIAVDCIVTPQSVTPDQEVLVLL